jgi:hypothetical protein
MSLEELANASLRLLFGVIKKQIQFGFYDMILKHVSVVLRKFETDRVALDQALDLP